MRSLGFRLGRHKSSLDNLDLGLSCRNLITECISTRPLTISLPFCQIRPAPLDRNLLLGLGELLT